MRKVFLVSLMFFVASVILSSCTFYVNTKNVSHAIRTEMNVSHPEKYRVGNPNIKFYPVVEDHRKTDITYRATDALIGAIKTSRDVLKHKDFVYLTKITIKKALKDTGWGIADNRTDANFIIDTDITDFTYGKMHAFIGMRWNNENMHGTLKLCTLDNRTIYQQKITKKGGISVSYLLTDATSRFGWEAWGLTKYLYNHLYIQLMDFLSSKNFIKAVYSHLDNATKEK